MTEKEIRRACGFWAVGFIILSIIDGLFGQSVALGVNAAAATTGMFAGIAAGSWKEKP